MLDFELISFEELKSEVFDENSDSQTNTGGSCHGGGNAGCHQESIVIDL